MTLPTTEEITPVEAIYQLLSSSAEMQEIIESSTTVEDGETKTIQSDSTEVSGDALIDGTLNLAGTLSLVGGLTPWSTVPNVYKWWEKSESERGPGQGQPPELHVWQPTGAPLERLTADNALLERTPTVEIYVFSYSESETADLAQDVIDFINKFISDKEQNTPFADIVPTNVEDFREQKLRQVTDHFVYMVECEITHLQDTDA